MNTVTGIPEMARSCTSSSNASITATGTTALWTPAAGKKFRVMSYHIAAGNNSFISLAPTTVTVKLQDGAGFTLCQHSLYIPGIQLSTSPGVVSVANVTIPGGGYVSSAANNPLNVVLSSTLSGGTVTVNVWGCEE